MAEPPADRAWFVVNLRAWLQQQRSQPVPEHDRLEAAIAQDNPAEVRRILAHGQFTAGQRRYLDDLPTPLGGRA